MLSSLDIKVVSSIPDLIKGISTPFTELKGLLNPIFVATFSMNQVIEIALFVLLRALIDLSVIISSAAELLFRLKDFRGRLKMSEF